MGSLSAGVTQVPAVTGVTLARATATLSRRGFTVGKVIQVTPGAGDSATVTEQSPLPPAFATVGAPVDLKVADSVGHAQLVVLTYEAKKIVVGGKRYIRFRVKVTIPVGLDAFLAGPMGRRYKHWSRRLDSGPHTERFSLPSRIKLVKGRAYHLEMYFRGDGQNSGLRRTQLH